MRELFLTLGGAQVTIRHKHTSPWPCSRRLKSESDQDRSRASAAAAEQYVCSLPSLRSIVAVLVTLAATAACGGDPYERYGAAVHDDVDAAMTDAFQMTARLQLTVVHNQIPDDSMAVAAATVTRAARDVRKRAVHFAAVTPPSDLGEAHAGLSGALSQVAEALDSLSVVFQQCAAGSPCQAHLDSVSNHFMFVGQDLQNGRGFVQRMLLRHGVMLHP